MFLKCSQTHYDRQTFAAFEVVKSQFPQIEFAETFILDLIPRRAALTLQTIDYNLDSQTHKTLIRLDFALTLKQTITVNGKNIRITIPAGIENGQVIKLKGYGSPAPSGGTAGDLLITFKLHNDTVFNRIGNDMQMSQEIELYAALLGGDVKVDTFEANRKLKIKL